MILLDAYPLVAYLRGQTGMRPLLDPLVRHGAVTSINAAETLDHLVRHVGTRPDDAVASVRALRLRTIDVGGRLARRAALLRANHYHRERCPVSLADCAAAAAALTMRWVDALATADPHLLGMVHAEGGVVHPLPDSTGRTWTPPG